MVSLVAANLGTFLEYMTSESPCQALSTFEWERVAVGRTKGLGIEEKGEARHAIRIEIPDGRISTNLSFSIDCWTAFGYIQVTFYVSRFTANTPPKD